MNAKTVIPVERVQRYLATLPNGLQSHPEARIQASVLASATRRLREEHPEVYAAIMGEFAERTAGWVPDVRAVATTLASRELFFDDDETFHEWMMNTVRQEYEKPTYRALFRLLNPGLLLLGLSRRWHVIRRGSNLRSLKQARTQGGSGFARVELTMPPGLFPELVVESVGRRVEVAVELSRAIEPRASVAEFAADRAVLELTWRQR